MTSLATAKILFLVALSFAPKDVSTIVASSDSENYNWNRVGSAWELKTKTFPSGVWFGQGFQPPADSREVFSLQSHSSRADVLINLNDNTWVETQGRITPETFIPSQLQNNTQVRQKDGGVFYTVDPGAPNQQVFTILYPRE